MQLGPLVDTHCHLDSARFGADVPEILERAAGAGVMDVVLPGVWPDGFEGLLRLSLQPSPVRLHVAWGLHPQVLPDVPAGADDVAMEEVRRMCERHRPVGIGECGLDYRVDTVAAPPERQRRVLRFHLELARDLRLPVLLHCLSAHDDLLVELDRVGPLPAGGIMHSYSGSAEQARPFLKRGLHLSFTGPVTWTGA
ncbi:MAG: TatD family hydrolase, partial [Myxococcota bacterium]